MNLPEAPRALYVHIPFCERKCHYCDFMSVAGTAREAEYMEALEREINFIGDRCPDIKLDTIFFGGGTPGLVDPQRLASVLHLIGKRFAIQPDAEITLEANPSSVSRDRAAQWRAAGFNRVSLGVQSLEADILDFLGRVHGADRAVAAVGEVRAGGFDNVNCDLIYAVPGLDDARWQSTVERMCQLEPDHISCYELTVEEGTPLHQRVAQGKVIPVNDEVALRQHWLGVDIMRDRGYEQYEVSNFAKPGSECRHNLVYWRNQAYLAAGVSAHGHLDLATARQLGFDTDVHSVSVRYWHPRNLNSYVERDLAPAESESILLLQRREETIMLGLRLREGVDASLVDPGNAAMLLEGDFVTGVGPNLRVTARGQQVLNRVALDLAWVAAAQAHS